MESKIPLLIVNKGQELITQLVPQIIDIASQTGIQNIGTSNVQLPDTCLVSDELQRILNLKNTLVDRLNTTVDFIEKLSKPLDTLVPLVNSLSTSNQRLNNIKTLSQLNIPFLPTSPPGAPSPSQAALVGLGIVENLLKDYLSPAIINNKNIITTIQSALDYVNNILTKLINIFKSIDQYLTNCGAISETTPLTSLNPYLQQLDQQQTAVDDAPINQVYRGFVLEVREEQFSPTVNRRRAVALNPQGIILLQTPLSFTSTPEVLIQQLKLIIDNSNLKAE
jgi:hypothetical protein